MVCGACDKLNMRIGVGAGRRGVRIMHLLRTRAATPDLPQERGAPPPLHRKTRGIEKGLF